VTESSSQNTNIVADRLRAWNPTAVAEVVEFHGQKTIVVPATLLRAAAERCRDDAALKFNFLSDATCVDRFPSELRFELNYHLISISRRDRVQLRVWLPGTDPVVDSLVPVWPGANWLEREIFDLFGIRFTGHPDLRRILLPDDWEGYPLRRDYPVVGVTDVHDANEIFRRSDAR